MLQFLLGFTLGNVVGMYVAQNYDFVFFQSGSQTGHTKFPVRFLTLQRSWKILRRMWKPRRNLLMTSPERAMFPRSTLCVHQGCNLPFRQQRSSRGLAWEVPPLLVS